MFFAPFCDLIKSCTYVIFSKGQNIKTRLSFNHLQSIYSDSIIHNYFINNSKSFKYFNSFFCTIQNISIRFKLFYVISILYCYNEIVSTVAALVPRAELEGDMGDSHVGLQARLMSQALRKITGIVSTTKCIVIFINQLREKVGVMYGNPETTTGGKALKFYASIRIDIRKSEAIKEGKEVIGNKTKIKIVKNKVAPPFRSTIVEVLYGEGISRLGEVLDFAVARDLIKKSGSFYSYNGERIGQGRENAKAWLIANPEAGEELEAKIREELLSNPVPLAEVHETESSSEDSDDNEEFEMQSKGVPLLL